MAGGVAGHRSVQGERGAPTGNPARAQERELTGRLPDGERRTRKGQLRRWGEDRGHVLEHAEDPGIEPCPSIFGSSD